MRTIARVFSLIASIFVFLSFAYSEDTERVTDASGGVQSNGDNLHPSISKDGLFIAFGSEATNLVGGDTNAVSDVFVLNRTSGEFTRVSVNSSGAQSDGASSHPVVSADGRFVAFRSVATNLVSNDTNDAADCFLHDRNTGTTTRVSVASDGTEGDMASCEPDERTLAISDNGGLIAFSSLATNLVADDTNGVRDVFVHLTSSGQTTRVSIITGGAEPTGESLRPHISGDGRFVVFESAEETFDAADANSANDIFLHDRNVSSTTLVSMEAGGASGDGASARPSITDDGKQIAFESLATDLVEDDTNDASDVFIYNTEQKTTTLLSKDNSGALGNGNSTAAFIAGDGSAVVYESLATNLASGDSNGKLDIYSYDLVVKTTARMSITKEGTQGTSGCRSAAISESQDIGLIAVWHCFDSLGAEDINNFSDVFTGLVDTCVQNGDKFAPGICGCETLDTDSDNDDTPDCNDNCPNDGNKLEEGSCGCGISDADENGNGSSDCFDPGEDSQPSLPVVTLANKSFSVEMESYEGNVSYLATAACSKRVKTGKKRKFRRVVASDSSTATFTKIAVGSVCKVSYTVQAGTTLTEASEVTKIKVKKVKKKKKKKKKKSNS